MIWEKSDIDAFVKRIVLPHKQQEGFDDRITYEDALEFARGQGTDGEPLLAALKKLK